MLYLEETLSDDGEEQGNFHCIKNIRDTVAILKQKKTMALTNGD